MSFQTQVGSMSPTRVILTDTSNTIIYTAALGPASIGKIRVVNTTSGAVTIDLSVTDGTTVWFLAKGYSVAANGFYELVDEIIPRGSSLKAQAGSGSSSLHVHVSHTDPGSRAPNAPSY